MTKPRILLVEDEPSLAFNLKLNLEAEGYEVEHAGTGTLALEKFEAEDAFDLIILDVMLPEMSGIEVAKTVRRNNSQVGILMLTALASDHSRVEGLQVGVDDYVTKPFHLQELLLRVKRMAKRAEYLGPEVKGKTLGYGPFQLDTELLQLTSPNGEFELTALEADILTEFMAQPKRVLSREYLLDKVWGVKGNIETRTVDNFIARLRKYMEKNPATPEYLVSVRGRGYRLIEPEAKVP